MKHLNKEQREEIIKKHFKKRISQPKLAKEYNVSKPTIFKICKKVGASPLRTEYVLDDAKIVNMYVNQKMSVLRIANEFGISTRPISRRLKLHGITKRRLSIRKKLENTIEHYHLKTKIWAAKVIDRDGLKCVLCGVENTRDNRLESHHIKPMRELENEQEVFDVNNGITLCRHCHITKVHYKENDYKEIFLNLIKAKF